MKADRAEEAIALTRRLVQIESTNPGAGEREIGEFIFDYLERSGAYTERFQVEENRYLVKGTIKGRTEHPALVFICHMDTVVKGAGWTKDAFGAESSEGKIWGRGACDMKAGLACALTAFREAAERASEKNEPPECSLVFIGTVDEEADMKGAEAAVQNGWVTGDDFVLDMEPTDGEIRMAHKGRLWFELDVNGVTAHASMPEKGADAIAGAAFMIAEIRKKISLLKPHHELGRTTVTFGQISGGYSPYVVSDHCKVTIDVRLASPGDREKAEQIIKDAIALGEREVPGVTGGYRITGDRPALETHRDSQLLRLLCRSVKNVTGHEAVVSVFPGYTDTAVIAGMTGNRNCMSYGPGDLALAHKPDEYVETEDIRRCVAVYADLICQMNAKPYHIW